MQTDIRVGIYSGFSSLTSTFGWTSTGSNSDPSPPLAAAGGIWLWIRALRRSMPSRAESCVVSSTKRFVGHLLSCGSQGGQPHRRVSASRAMASRRAFLRSWASLECALIRVNLGFTAFSDFSAVVSRTVLPMKCCKHTMSR